ncbi:unnamed protein product [Pleuronectes platessa]|uniref:Uncharacterized protein n=1 Tax=Pleuronectes platessa TaxID=8262 RepID=A0A9N7ZDK2_PLEPL|nr:unnamed protein product [Pleuronectes platessa]
MSKILIITSYFSSIKDLDRPRLLYLPGQYIDKQGRAEPTSPAGEAAAAKEYFNVGLQLKPGKGPDVAKIAVNFAAAVFHAPVSSCSCEDNLSAIRTRSGRSGNPQ